MSIYYMAPSSTGGTEDGSSDNPFLSWSDVYAVIGHNDTVVLKDGTYTIGTEFAGSNLLPTVTTTLSGSHPDNVIIQGAGGSSGDVTSNGGGLFKKPLSVAYTNDFTVNIHNIKFRDILTGGTTPIFATAGDDEFNFSNCIFDTIAVNSPTRYGGGGFIGPEWGVSYNYRNRADRVNGRGIFKNCIFKNMTATASRYAGYFQCHGMHLRFANCVLHFDYTARTSGSTQTGSNTLGRFFYWTHYGYRSGSYQANWVTFGQGDTDLYASADVKLLNCIIFNSSPGVTRHFSQANLGTTSGQTSVISTTTRSGYTPWHNSELINCSFYEMENGSLNTSSYKYAIEKFTNCLGSPLNGSRVDVDPLFISLADNDFGIRPGSPLIANGLPIYESFYNQDKPPDIFSSYD